MTNHDKDCYCDLCNLLGNANDPENQPEADELEMPEECFYGFSDADPGL